MTNKILKLIEQRYTLKEKNVGEFKTFKAKGMTFVCESYHANGLGHVSVMKAKGFFGLMKMDTLVIAPENKDLPLLSYDRIVALGNDNLIIELYDTMGENRVNLRLINSIKNKYSLLPERFAEGEEPKHWYDDIRLPETTSKKGKKAHRISFDAYAVEYIYSYLSLAAEQCDAAEKRARTDVYVDGLLTQGGPATDVFKKELGEEKTQKILKTVLFGTK
jgi:hypothetical protein